MILKEENNIEKIDVNDFLGELNYIDSSLDNILFEVDSDKRFIDIYVSLNNDYYFTGISVQYYESNLKETLKNIAFELKSWYRFRGAQSELYQEFVSDHLSTDYFFNIEDQQKTIREENKLAKEAGKTVMLAGEFLNNNLDKVYDKIYNNIKEYYR